MTPYQTLENLKVLLRFQFCDKVREAGKFMNWWWQEQRSSWCLQPGLGEGSRNPRRSFGCPPLTVVYQRLP